MSGSYLFVDISINPPEGRLTNSLIKVPEDIDKVKLSMTQSMRCE